MMRLSLIAAALMITTTYEAHGGGCGDHEFRGMQKPDGTWVRLVATDKDVERDPVWAPGRSEPPMSPGRAYDLAAAWARANWKRFDSFELGSVDLQSVGCDLSHHKWVYVVELEPVIDGNRLFGSFYVLGVLLDGTVIPPTTGKKSD